MEGEVRAVIKTGSGGASLREELVDVGFARLNVGDVKVDSVLSVLAACFARSIAESSGLKEVEVSVELYTDLDTLLDGLAEEADYLIVKVRTPITVEAALKGLSNCVFYNMLKHRIKSVEVVHS
ncbi:MAG: hypothetical protein P3X22_002670 [Thermoprotei archaeon]|nr:hypothetical protein [Thermoprotei archaeon]